jgi:hypothetical protein
MGIFFDSASDKARKASIAASRAQSALRESARLMGDIEHRLYHISRVLPNNAPASSTRPMFVTMRRIQHHAEQTLQHVRHLDTHIRHAERHASTSHK